MMLKIYPSFVAPSTVVRRHPSVESSLFSGVPLADSSVTTVFSPDSLMLSLELKFPEAEQFCRLLETSGDRLHFVAQRFSGLLLALAYDKQEAPVVYFGQPGQVERLQVDNNDSTIPKFLEDGAIHYAYSFKSSQSIEGAKLEDAELKEQVLVVVQHYSSKISVFWASPKQWEAHKVYPYPQFSIMLPIALKFDPQKR